jgi:hypothetical protein
MALPCWSSRGPERGIRKRGYRRRRGEAEKPRKKRTARQAKLPVSALPYPASGSLRRPPGRRPSSLPSQPRPLSGLSNCRARLLASRTAHPRTSRFRISAFFVRDERRGLCFAAIERSRQADLEGEDKCQGRTIGESKKPVPRVKTPAVVVTE